jgi:hypothetical protein
MIVSARYFLFAGFVLACLVSPSGANAGSAESFLQSMSGTWRGKGTMYISQKSKNSPVRCKITSTLDKAARKLRNKGRCATAQKKAAVSGAITYSTSSNALGGAYLRSFGDLKLTRSSGTISGNRMTLNSTFIEKGSNKLVHSRSVIKRISARKFTVTIFEKVKGTYQRRGKIAFSK